MINKFLKLLNNRDLREKYLLLGFIVILLLVWIGNFSNKLYDWKNEKNEASNELEIQKQWLDKSSYYEKELALALEKVDPSKTFSALQLVEKIDAINRSIKIAEKTDSDVPRTKEGEIFNDHTLKLRLNNVNIEEFKTFIANIEPLSPYISPTSVRIKSNQRNPELLNIRLEINSFDLREKTF